MGCRCCPDEESPSLLSEVARRGEPVSLPPWQTWISPDTHVFSLGEKYRIKLGLSNSIPVSDRTGFANYISPDNWPAQYLEVGRSYVEFQGTVPDTARASKYDGVPGPGNSLKTNEQYAKQTFDSLFKMYELDTEVTSVQTFIPRTSDTRVMTGIAGIAAGAATLIYLRRRW